MKIKINYFAAMLLAMFAGGGIGAQGAEQPKKATSHTIEYNQKFLGAHGLDENDKQDFQDAEKGFMATLKDPNIKTRSGGRSLTSLPLTLPRTNRPLIR